MRVAETFRNVAVTTGDGYASNAWNAQQAERPDEAVLTTQTILATRVWTMSLRSAQPTGICSIFKQFPCGLDVCSLHSF